MLAAAPSSFKKDGRNPLDVPTHKSFFNIPRGWTTNNAGTDIQLYVYPYLLTRATNKIFIVCVHEFNSLWPAGCGIFLEVLDETNMRATPSYRRVTVDGDTWIKTNLYHHNAQRLGSLRQLFITRHAPVNYRTADGIRGFYVGLKLPLSATCTARSGFITDHYRALKSGPILSEVDKGKSSCSFKISSQTDLGLFGHVKITLAYGVDIFVGFGFDSAFSAKCVVLPLCTKLYEQGLTAHVVSRGYDEVTRVPDRHHEHGHPSDESCEFFTLSCVEGVIRSSGDLYRIGIYLKMDMDLKAHSQTSIRINAETFLQHYFPEKAAMASSESMSLWEDSNVLQDRFDVARKRLLGWT
jgi:hypothetical protein